MLKKNYLHVSFLMLCSHLSSCSIRSGLVCRQHGLLAGTSNRSCIRDIFQINSLYWEELTPYIVGYTMFMDVFNVDISKTFIEVPLFSKRWSEIGLGDEE